VQLNKFQRKFQAAVNDFGGKVCKKESFFTAEGFESRGIAVILCVNCDEVARGRIIDS
jgi:hypothetical protein